MTETRAAPEQPAAPAPIRAKVQAVDNEADMFILSVGSKAAGVVLLMRLLGTAIPDLAFNLEKLLMAMAAGTILYGSLCAIPQRNLKRLLGYSSIANAGYLLLGIAALASGCFLRSWWGLVGLLPVLKDMEARMPEAMRPFARVNLLPGATAESQQRMLNLAAEIYK